MDFTLTIGKVRIAGLRRNQNTSGCERPTAWLTICGALGTLALIPVCAALLYTIVFAILSAQFLYLTICVSSVGLAWLLTKCVKVIWLRILARAFTVAVFLWPFIPHRSIEWVSPFPPAGFWVLVGLKEGDLMAFELQSILIATCVMWLAGIAVYEYRHHKSMSSQEIKRIR